MQEYEYLVCFPESPSKDEELQLEKGKDWLLHVKGLRAERIQEWLNRKASEGWRFKHWMEGRDLMILERHKKP